MTSKPPAQALAVMLLGLLVWITGCTLGPADLITPALETAGPTTSPTLMADTGDPEAGDGWQALAPGLDFRSDVPGAGLLAQVTAVRLDPTRYTVRVHYQPGEVRTLAAWQAELPDARLIVNASFFTPEQQALGLVIADGVRYGASYTDRGGTFALLDGVPLLRSNLITPYAGEAYQQAVQGFPMLVLDGEAAFDSRSRSVSRRSAAGLDSQGRFLIFATPLLGLSLPDLSTWLADFAPYDLTTAVNLDGGGSTMLTVVPNAYTIQSFDPVPVVLAVYPR